MPYEWVGFRVDPPIRETIDRTPDDIELISENGVITEMRVLIGEERTKKIKESDHFRKILVESEAKRIERNPAEAENASKKSENIINQLENEIRKCAIQRANYFINQLNYKLDSANYEIKFKELAIMMFRREISYGAGGYVKSEYITDIFQLNGEDNLPNRLINSYSNGLKALKNRDPVSAYKFFYLSFPEGHQITGDRSIDEDLKILRHGASHNVLNDRGLQARAKELLGEDFVKPGKIDPENTYAIFDMTNPQHLALFEKMIPIVKEKSREYIDAILSQAAAR